MEESGAPPERDSMDYDVVIVGAGPAGLAAAIRLKQRAAETGAEISVAVLEKGSEVGAHILSGAVIDPCGLDALIPDWRDRDAPLTTKVTQDRYLILGEQGGVRVPNVIMPPLMRNHGNYVGSLGDLCRWLAGQAEALGVEIYPGFAAADLVLEGGAVKGVITNDFGVAKDGSHKDGFQPGMALMGRYVLVAEGARGSLTKRLIAEYKLDADCEPQKYGIGLKEVWRVTAENHRPGLIQHTMGWPLPSGVGGGSFLYHYGSAEERRVAVGLVVHLNYRNPYLDPYLEFQRFKHHPDIAPVLEGGERLSYGARAISEGGFQSVPELAFPGGALIGDAAGFLNVPRIKGSHNAIRTGMLAADSAFDALSQGRGGDVLDSYPAAYRTGDVARDLRLVRNVKPLWSRFGLLGGVVLGGIDMWLTTLLRGLSPFGSLKHGATDAAATQPAERHKPIAYPKPDGALSFDRMSSVFLSNTNHDEDQPSHLKLRDPAYPTSRELPVYGAPSTRYCPAGVYEYVAGPDGAPRFQINAQNCVHCKTCDIKDPEQTIIWTPPEGGGGPNYPGM